MSVINRPFWFLIIIMLIVGGIITSCTSPPPLIPWFNEHLQIEEAVFPKGVNFSINREEVSDYIDFNEYSVVSNTSDTPIFFSAVSFWGGSLDKLGQSCPMENLCLKVVSGQAWKWDTLNFDPPWEYGWTLVDEYDQYDPLELNLSGSHFGNSDYTILLIDLRNEFDYGDTKRPDTVSIPPPQSFELPYIYGSDELDITLTVSYSINLSYSNYEPNDYSGIVMICIGGIILLALLIVIALVILFNRFLNNLDEKAKLRTIEKQSLDGKN